MRILLRALTTALLVSAGMAAAQTGPPSQQGIPNNQGTPSPQGETTVPPGQGVMRNGGAPPPRDPGSGSSTEEGTPSSALSHSGGVIHPPATPDPGVVPPPNEGLGRTPVIRPPGTPGGDPTVQPK